MKIVSELPDSFINIQLLSSKKTDAMSLARSDTNHKPSCSKILSIRRGGTLNVTELTVVSPLIDDAANTS